MSDSPAHPHAHVEVLLATFQGAPYLQPQVDSILAQTGVTVSILARDDGSSDRTTSLLDRWAEAGALRLLPTGLPSGSATGNFRVLLQQSRGNYVALADQDDVWNSTKLSRSMKAMQALEERHGAEVPLLVFSDLTVVDRDLQPVPASLWQTNGLDPANIHRLGRLLGENIVTGCTALLNRPLVALAATMPQPPADDPLALQHDHWIALLACTLGHAAWLPEQTALYRQHGANVLGAADGGSVLRRLLSAEALLARRLAHRRLQEQAGSFQATYGHLLTPAQLATLRAFQLPATTSAFARLKAMLDHDLWRGTTAKNAVAVLDLFR